MIASDRIAELREAKAKRDAAREEKEEKANELEYLELEAKFDAELGPRGRAFEIINATSLGEGFIVLKLGSGILWRNFEKALQKKDGPSVVDVESLIIPNLVHPSPEKYRQIVMDRPFVADRCASALGDLYGVKAEHDKGK